jgi:hypothetical protein
MVSMPPLRQFYAQMKQAGRPFEVVFMSCDRDPKSFADYLAHMPVCGALPALSAHPCDKAC